MRSIGNHALQMGLASCAVQMMTAIDNHDRKGSMWHPHDDGSFGKVGMPKVCNGVDGCGEVVQQADVVKGYDHDGENVILTDADLDTIEKNSGADIQVLRFIHTKEINPLLFSGEKCYYLVPDTDKKRSGKMTMPTYLSIRQVLDEEDLVGVVSYTKWGKNRIALMRVEPTEYGGCLVLQNMLWPDELREPAFPVLEKAGDTDVDPRLLPTMRMVVESMTEGWNPEDYEDTYELQLSAAIEAKAEGKPVTELATEDAAPPPDDIADLLAKLEASAKKAPAKKAPAKKAAPKKRVA